MPPIDVGGARRSAQGHSDDVRVRLVAGLAVQRECRRGLDRGWQRGFRCDCRQFGRDPTDVVGYFTGDTSTATKTNTPIIDIPQSVTILHEAAASRSQQSRHRSGRCSTSPALRWRKAKRNRDQITIRGQNTTADFYIDGIRDDAEYYRDLYNIQAVEVLKGPSALIFGRGGGGGVVNRVTKKADGETMMRSRVVGGSFGRKRLTADFGRGDHRYDRRAS